MNTMRNSLDGSWSTMSFVGSWMHRQHVAPMNATATGTKRPGPGFLAGDPT